MCDWSANQDLPLSHGLKRDGAFVIEQGDCLELLKKVPDKSVDMVLCDLPYGCTRNEWDKPIDLQALWLQYKRIVKSGGVVALFGKQRYTIEVASSNLKDFRYKIVWQKNQGTDFLNANRKPLSAHEDVCLFYDKQPTYNKIKRTGFESYITDKTKHDSRLSTNLGNFNPRRLSKSEDGSRDPIDVVSYPIERNREHSTSKPIGLLEWLIKSYTNAGEVVLDNAMGVGSTGIACMNTGRRFIGMELNQHFFDIARERIAAAHSNLQLCKIS